MEKNFDKVKEILAKHDKQVSNLIPILQETQEFYKYLPEDIMAYIAKELDVAPARVFGVATFFSQFTLKPKGKYIIKVCDGTACHVKKSENLVNLLRKKLNLKNDEITTADQLFTIETVSCLGACGLAPVIVINEEVYGNMTEKKIDDLLEGILQKEAVK